MKVNFRIISFTEIEFNGIRVDLHNDFDFIAEDMKISVTQIVLHFRKSEGYWVRNVACQHLYFTVDNYTFLNQIEPNGERIEEDLCLSGITFFYSDSREENDLLTDKDLPGETDDIIFSFESERIIRINCEKITVAVE